MTGRERVKRAMHLQSVDKAPLRYKYSSVGFYEHGDKLNDLYATLPGDFEPCPRVPIPVLPPEHFDADGRYHYFIEDAWGTTWEHRIYGITGIPCKYPINTPEEAESYQAPPSLVSEGPEYEAYAKKVLENKSKGYYTLSSQWGDVYEWPNFYEKMISLYGDENVLCDILMDEPGINHLADQVIEYDAGILQRAVKGGADGFLFGDDYGTARGLMMSPECWRRFIKPRLKRLFQPAVDAGLDIHFHSCGVITPILPDLKEIGVTSIWPEIPAYNMQELAARCRELELAVEIHTDRARTMTYGTPDQVREMIKREIDTFKVMDGGAWLYVETDNGFPFENIEAQIETLSQYR